ncbi:MAG: hypothetical protein AAFR04_15720 [Pseudomonadota bacterium]
MRSKPPVRATVVKREQKRDQARDFIQAFIDASGQDAAATAAPVGEVTLIARSPASPMACALADLDGPLAARGLMARVVFALLDTDVVDTPWCDGESGMRMARMVRRARQPELLDAHEQLVLSPATSWLGDSMRREPAKRDAFEHFSHADQAMAARAARSFEKLWLRAQPVTSILPLRMGAVLNAPREAVIDAVESARDEPPLVLTRH